ncbi:MAG: MFS transporter [Acidobacteriaceae bacterium]|nr:MFS transporter [Acidobacteriaceae bacterium]
MENTKTHLKSSNGAGVTRIRYRVVAFAVALAAITYLDRVCISILAPDIMRDLRLTNIQMSYVFSAFTLAYAVFEIPTAWWADRVGSRKVLTRIVLWWSAFTMATAGSVSYGGLLAVRFLFGIGEAGAWPNAARVFSRWVPTSERGRVQGIFFAGAHLSGGVTPMFVAYMATFLHWRVIFVIFGGIGILWALSWYWWFRDEPRDHPFVGIAELDLIERTRGLPPAHAGHWGDVWRTRSLFPLCLQYFANSYGFYFFITWLPLYLLKARHMEKRELAIFAGLPLLLSVIADITGGTTTDALSRRFGKRLGRCGVGGVAYLCAAVTMLSGTLASDAQLAGCLIALAGAASMLTLAPAWATAIDLGGRNSAVLSAAMNTAGQIGGVLSPIVLAYIVDRFKDWSMPLYILSGLYLIAAICWTFIHPGQAPVRRIHD